MAGRAGFVNNSSSGAGRFGSGGRLAEESGAVTPTLGCAGDGVDGGSVGKFGPEPEGGASPPMLAMPFITLGWLASRGGVRIRAATLESGKGGESNVR